MTGSPTTATAAAFIAAILTADCGLFAQEASPTTTTTTVGMTGKIEQLVLPGPELVAKPIEDSSMPVVVRILSVYPHGTAFRYDIEYYGLEPGSFNLADYLQAKDGEAEVNLPAIPLEVKPVLPPGQIQPNPLPVIESPRLGGYRTFLIIAGAVWLIGLLVMIFYRRKKPDEDLETEKKTLAFAEQLRPLIEDAVAGRLDESGRAELERMLLGYWRRRLDLQSANPAEAMSQLKRHPEAGPLLSRLEEWLHRPAAAAATGEVDVTALLKPYRDLPEEALSTE